MAHEHKRRDRDNHVVVSPHVENDANFIKLNADKSTIVTPYDEKSIMNYPQSKNIKAIEGQ